MYTTGRRQKSQKYQILQPKVFGKKIDKIVRDSFSIFAKNGQKFVLLKPKMAFPQMYKACRLQKSQKN